MITLSFLLIAALCLDASIAVILYFPDEKMNWTEARLYCQKNHIDLVTWKLRSRGQLIKAWQDSEVKQVWIGLRREDNVWKWVDTKSGQGFSEVSPSQDWTNRKKNRRCALVSDDSKWYSERCSNKHYFYCSKPNGIQHYQSKLTWDCASEYCKGNSQHLATITNENTDQLKDAGWIGLQQKADGTWKWIDGKPPDHTDWAPGQPLNADCGFFDLSTEKWFSEVCSEELEFVCYDDLLVVVNENKTWEEALSHCKSMETPCEQNKTCKYRHELLSLGPSTDYNNIRERISSATTNEVWTGLRFLAGEWWWMNGKSPDDKGELPDCPSHWKHCGTLSKNDTNKWIIRDCAERRNFICSRHVVQDG